MQTITKKQLSMIAKTITKLSAKKLPLRHANILEIFAKGLGYRDYNALYVQLEHDTGDSTSIEKIQKVYAEESVAPKVLLPDFNILLEKKEAINVLEMKLNLRNTNDIPWEEFKTLTHAYEREKDNYRVLVLKYMEYVKNITDDQGQICPRCLGKGGKDVAVEVSGEEAMWYDDGAFYELGFEKCSLCFGGGRTTHKIVKNYNKSPNFFKEEIFI